MRPSFAKELDALIKAAGCPDEENFGSIVARIQNWHDAILATHRVVFDQNGGADRCGNCGADIEDALQDGVICKSKCQTCDGYMGFGRVCPDCGSGPGRKP